MLDTSKMSTGELERRGWHPCSPHDRLVQYKFRAAYHRRKAGESDFLSGVYHTLAAGANEALQFWDSGIGDSHGHKSYR